MLLCEVSKNAKEALVANVGCGVTVATFHAIVSARCEVTRGRQLGGATGNNSGIFTRQLKHSLAVDGEMSTFKANSPMASQLAVTGSVMLCYWGRDRRRDKFTNLRAAI